MSNTDLIDEMFVCLSFAKAQADLLANHFEFQDVELDPKAYANNLYDLREKIERIERMLGDLDNQQKAPTTAIKGNGVKNA